MKTFRFWLETVGVINSTAEALQFLELSPGATKEEVQAAIRRLARKYHPDLGGDIISMKTLTSAMDWFHNNKYNTIPHIASLTNDEQQEKEAREREAREKARERESVRKQEQDRKRKREEGIASAWARTRKEEEPILPELSDEEIARIQAELDAIAA